MKERMKAIRNDVDGLWSHIERRASSVQNASDVYGMFDLRGEQVAVIGPWFLPHDATALQLAYSVGFAGSVYAVDPQGDGTHPNTEQCYGSGNAQEYQRQIALFRRYGMELGSYEWAGANSSIMNITQTIPEVSLIAEHDTVGFLSRRMPKEDLRRGIAGIVRRLPIGGVWIHFGKDPVFLSGLMNDFTHLTALDHWSDVFGIRTVRIRVEEDAYAFPVPAGVLDFINTDHRWGPVFDSEYDWEGDYRKNTGTLRLHEHRIMYPRKWAFVSQKIAEV